MKRILIAGLIVIVVGAAGFVALAWRHAAIDPAAPPAAFAPDLVEKGEVLAAIGDCAVCHTAAGSEPYTGGLALPTPFGTIHSTNITPDPETGIGAWSLEAFRRAMHQGVDREGNHLYPAFPYDHFTRVSDADVEAIYAYLMSQPAVKAEARENGLAFPYNQRFLMAAWSLLFLDEGRFAPDPAKSEAWNRGAYLAQGLGHCGACHTPRNSFGAVDAKRHLAGGEAEDWHAPALDAGSPAPLPWAQDALVNYFLDGWDGDHGIAAGPMKPVVDAFALLSEDDAYALAEYLLSFQDTADVEKRTADAKAFAEERDFGAGTPATGPARTEDMNLAAGQETFVKVCANCHKAGADLAPLALTSTVNGPDPRNLIHIVMDGLKPPLASPNRSMPAFAATLNDLDVTNLVLFTRAHFSGREPWPEVARHVAAARAAHPSP